MIPDIQVKQSFSKQTARAFGGICGERASAFPQIEASQNLSSDAAPYLAPRAPRVHLSGLPGSVQRIYPYQSGFVVLTEIDTKLCLYYAANGSVTSLKFEDLSYMVEYDPSAVWFGSQLFFPALRFAADVAKRRINYFDKQSDLVSGVYTQNSAGETVLTLTFEGVYSPYRVGEYAILHAVANGKDKVYYLPVDGVFSMGEVLRFRGKNLPDKDTFEGGKFYLKRDVPLCTRFVTCKNRLWGWDGGDILYASAAGAPLSFVSGEEIPEEDRGVVFYPGAGRQILAVSSFAGRPVCFTESSLILVAGDKPSEYYSEICEKYGLARGAERTVATVGKSLFFYSDQGVCRYSGTDAELVFPVSCDQDACACAIGSKYVLYDGSLGLYIYDTDTGILTKEAAEPFLLDLAASDKGVYGLVSNYGQGPAFVPCLYGHFQDHIERIWKPENGYTLGEEPVVESHVTFFPHFLPDERISAYSVMLEAELAEGASLTLFVGYDGEEPLSVGTVTGKARRHRVELPVPPRRCERLTLSLTGSADYCIYAISIRARAC